MSDPKIFAIASIGGIIPSLLWLWFWLKEDKRNPEPKLLLTVIFILGMLAVICVLPIQRFIQIHVESHNLQITLWATTEEIMKYLAVMVVLYKTKFAEEPIDWPIYMISTALGFAALENALFLVKPLAAGSTVVSLLTGQLRFLGSTLLHTVASGMIGIGIGLSMHMTQSRKTCHILIGIFFAIALHNVFNFFIIRNGGNDFLKVFGFLWVVTIIVMLLFEKVRRMA